MLPPLGTGHFYPYLFSSLNCLHSTKFCQQLHQGDSIKSKWTQCSSSTNAQNLNCTAVGQSGSNSALGILGFFFVFVCLVFFEGGKAIRMAILSARAESGLLYWLQSHPLQQTGGFAGQGLQCCFSSLQSLLMHIHSHHTSQHREISPAAQPPTQITALPSPTDLRVSLCRALGFICTLAGCMLSHSIEFYVGFALHPQSFPSHTIRGTTVVMLRFYVVTCERKIGNR